MGSAAKYSTYGLTKQVWPQKALLDEILVNNALLGLIRKDETLTEEVRHESIGYGASQGVGRKYEDAKRYKSASKSQKFQISTREFFGSFSLEGKLFRAWEYGGNDALLVDPLKRDGKNLLQNMRNRLARYVHGDGVGALGRMTAASTPLASLTITLRNAADLRNFRPDMPVQFESTGATGGTVKTGVAIVASVGTTDNPTVTFAGSANVGESVPEVAASDFLYAVGTYDDSPIYGMESWNPNHSGSPGTFLSVNRNVLSEWLAGTVLDGRGKSFLQRIQLASQRVVDAGGTADTYFCSTRQFLNGVFELGDKVKPVKAPAAKMGKISSGVSYEGIEVVGVGGPIRVFPDVWMPDNVERCGQLDTLYLGSMGPFLHWDAGNGPGDLRTEEFADAREIRAVGDLAFVNTCPGYWCRVGTA